MKSALLIIDVQHGLVDELPRPDAIGEVIEKINHLTGRARTNGIPVIFIQHELSTGQLLYGSESWQLQADLTVHGTDQKVRKTTPDSFLGTNLGEILASTSTTNLIICGYASEFCVDTTTRRAAALGFTVQLVADAHTTHDKTHATAEQIRTHHNTTLANIKSFGPTITAVRAVEVEF